MSCEPNEKNFEDCAIGKVPEHLFDKPPTIENEILAMRLRLLMNKLDGEDKCLLCKATEALEKEKPSNNFSWWIVIFLTIFLFSGNSESNFFNDDTFLKALTETLKNMNDKNSEVHNESSEMHSDK